MQRLLEQGGIDIAAAAINNTMENNPGVKSYGLNISRMTSVSSCSSSEQDQEEEKFVEQEDFEDAKEEEPAQEGK
jgi:hypothetical protein